MTLNSNDSPTMNPNPRSEQRKEKRNRPLKLGERNKKKFRKGEKDHEQRKLQTRVVLRDQNRVDWQYHQFEYNPQIYFSLIA
ncbi:serine/threonine-protein phosphatase 7-like protein [Corchorus olitorius]|uniref:Serine/threonine-protein phosphatase 7-like protein n=1 Tax=Corchorus olitorius TaxID=93759 RepID=A0A1R3I903_9ROSI|nr:serine/threonine-protein phosphatase 7-like protein [Corchorus olitorius]